MTPFTRILLVGLIGWGVLPSGAMANPDQPVIERIRRGSVLIQRDGNGLYDLAREGDTLNPQDMVLVPGAGTRVDIRCPNNSWGRPPVRGGLSGVQVICPDVGTARRSRNDNDVLLLSTGVFPYGLSLMESPGQLRWPPLAGASTYEVALYRQDQQDLGPLLWQTEATGTTVAYDGPPLAVKETYVLVVTPASAAQDQGCGATLERWRRGQCYQITMTLLQPDAIASLQALSTTLETAAIDDAAAALALAYSYAADDLHWRTIDVLEPLITNSEQPAAVYQLLATAYLQAGWINQAQQTYTQAQQLAAMSGDRSTHLQATLGLAKVAAWQLDSAATKDHLWRALATVSDSQDLDQADNIVQWLRKLN